MKVKRWLQQFIRPGLPRFALQTVILYLALALFAQLCVWLLSTPETYLQAQDWHMAY